MYCECAIIATPNEGADEIISHEQNGILIEEVSQISLQQNILLLLENETSRHQYSKLAKKDVSEKFPWGRSIHLYEKIFNTRHHVQQTK
jgi:glycosyltransferase involved in cell wall biosynthesis